MRTITHETELLYRTEDDDRGPNGLRRATTMARRATTMFVLKLMISAALLFMAGALFGHYFWR